MPYLTDQQLQVVDALSNGAALIAAAAQAGVHRNTISNWRNSPDFREALAIAHHERAALYRDRAVDFADLAFETIRAVLTDPNSSPSTRLRAAIFIIDKVSTPPKFEKEKPATMASLLVAIEETGRMRSPQPPADAQNCTTPNESGLHLHNPAQKPEPYRRPEPKTGRNGTCPCGSGKKYKHCCLGKSSAAAA
ncbi:MAG: SEC-C metal-binding domain-containing protein [Bryobacteraceae bacterium]|jgi:preprotein translocase subunit SecA